jgi:hypothetical protein
MCFLALSVGGSFELDQKMAAYFCCSVVILLSYELVIATVWNKKNRHKEVR